MRCRELGFLLLLLVVGDSVAAQQSAPTSATSDPQAVVLIQRALLALSGGVPVSDVTLSGTARRIAGSDDESGTATLKATSLGDGRVDLILPSGNRSEIRSHSAVPLATTVLKGVPASMAQMAQQAGTWSGPDGIVHGIASHNLTSDSSWFFPAMTVAKLVSSQNELLSYVGTETFNGQSVIHVSAMQQFLALRGGPPELETLGQRLSRVDLYLDSTTLLPVALAFNTHPDEDALVDIPTEIHFSNYRVINGVQVPFDVQKYVNNGLVIEFQLDDITLNSGLAPSAFDIQ